MGMSTGFCNNEIQLQPVGSVVMSNRVGIEQERGCLEALAATTI
jgi:hypothetical protein